MIDLIPELRAAGLIHTATPVLRPLTGGVSSEIVLVDERVVVKRALPQLRVADEWLADVSRNRYERAYLEYAARVCPGSVPQVVGHGDGWFAMEYLGPGFDNWKSLMLAGRCEPVHAERAGSTLARIHTASQNEPNLRHAFATLGNFHQLRIDPYLLTTGQRHPDLRFAFDAAAAGLRAASECLVHGDYSPKNILVTSDRLVVLDCEVAWFGDPAFDLAFLLNHLHLKALHLAEPRFEASVTAFLDAYQPSPQLRQRTARLVLLLMLARVDGKSPVEYLTPGKRERVRQFTTPRIREGVDSLATIIREWFDENC
ncbi:MAG: aminoglycoside phosphotransferase family protein [Bryobacteraceae bacterium]|nr:aminoglycoside phosphotransferase family protein [Bryobacteraceae bacterium]